MREVDYKKLGQRIRERRLTLGMTQQQIAEAIGLEPSNISHIERGGHQDHSRNSSCDCQSIGNHPGPPPV